VNPDWPVYSDNFIVNEVILPGHANCRTEACETCLIGERLLQKYGNYNEVVIVTFTKWEKNKENGSRFEQNVYSQPLSGAVKEVGLQMKKFVQHHQIKRLQSAAYVNDKKHSTEDSPMIQFDYAENYKCDFQDEIQSAYYSKKQITVFTCCIWQGEKDRKIAILE
jgi:hypothetical protein